MSCHVYPRRTSAPLYCAFFVPMSPFGSRQLWSFQLPICCVVGVRKCWECRHQRLLAAVQGSQLEETVVCGHGQSPVYVQSQWGEVDIMLIMLLPAISHRRLSVCPSMCDHVLKTCEHDILQTASGNFKKFTTSVQLNSEINSLVVKVKRWNVKVTLQANVKLCSPVDVCTLGRNASYCEWSVHCTENFSFTTHCINCILLLAEISWNKIWASWLVSCVYWFIALSVYAIRVTVQQQSSPHFTHR